MAGHKKNLFATVLQDQDGPTPIYGKNPLKNFFGTKGLVALGCGMQHWGHGPNKVWKNDDIRVTLTFFIESQTFFYRKVIFFYIDSYKIFLKIFLSETRRPRS